MSGSPGNVNDGRLNSKSGIGIGMLKDSDGRLGNEMSGSPGSVREGRPQLMKSCHFR